MYRHLYFVEVGVLIPPTSEEYEFYQIRDFHNEFGFYDENKLTFLTPQQAIDYGMDYVKNGVENTYAILYDYECNIEKWELQEIKDFFYCEHSLDISADCITDFFYKKNNKIIKGGKYND